MNVVSFLYTCGGLVHPSSSPATEVVSVRARTTRASAETVAAQYVEDHVNDGDNNLGGLISVRDVSRERWVDEWTYSDDDRHNGHDYIGDGGNNGVDSTTDSRDDGALQSPSSATSCGWTTDSWRAHHV